MGGEAVANGDDISDWDGAERLINTAVDTFGGLDVAGQQRRHPPRPHARQHDRGQEWDAVIKVHLKGTFAPVPLRRRLLARAAPRPAKPIDARIINTTSPSGIYGNAGQTNYGAAKAGIAAFTIIAAMELARYGVTVNAIAPAALTRMTEDLGMGQADEETEERMSPRWIAPIVTWLASTESAGRHRAGLRGVGRVLAVAEGWHRGPRVEPVDDPTQHGAGRRRARSPKPGPNADMDGERRPQLTTGDEPMPINPDAVGTRVEPVETLVDARRTPALRPRRGCRRATSSPFTTENTTGVAAAGAADDGRGPRHRRGGGVRRASARSTRRCSSTASRPSRCTSRSRSRARSAPSARSPASTTRARARSS